MSSEIAPNHKHTTEEIKTLLELPFRAAEISWRVLGDGEKADGEARIIPYAQRSAYMRRLDTLFGPGGWTQSFSMTTVSNGLMRANTPVRKLVSRHTRELLRRYYKEGKLTTPIADRSVGDEFIQMSAEERALYEEVENDWKSLILSLRLTILPIGAERLRSSEQSCTVRLSRILIRSRLG